MNFYCNLMIRAFLSFFLFLSNEYLAKSILFTLRDLLKLELVMSFCPNTD